MVRLSRWWLKQTKTRSLKVMSVYSVNWYFFWKYWSNQQNIIKFVIYESKLVEIDTLLVQNKNKQDRSRRCQNIQSNGKYLSHRQNIVRFVIYGSELMEIDTLLAKFTRNSKICFFGGHFVFFLKTRLAITSKVISRFCLFSLANTRPSFTFMA